MPLPDLGAGYRCGGQPLLPRNNAPPQRPGGQRIPAALQPGVVGIARGLHHSALAREPSRARQRVWLGPRPQQVVPRRARRRALGLEQQHPVGRGRRPGGGLRPVQSAHGGPAAVPSSCCLPRAPLPLRRPPVPREPAGAMGAGCRCARLRGPRRRGPPLLQAGRGPQRQRAAAGPQAPRGRAPVPRPGHGALRDHQRPARAVGRSGRRRRPCGSGGRRRGA
mmetsp:Transcript_99717/g.316537  ORF Transcript_99717/g.316537 Transcript_99717/m.316537 type:complete len:222 (-) Transcript_99717:124-789(-)